MSPIIYTPHQCENPKDDLPEGTLWQCDACDKVWELDKVRSRDSPVTANFWEVTDDPRRSEVLRDACSPTTKPKKSTSTVTPDMVELVLNEYEEHAKIGRLDNAWWCTRCPNPIPRGITPAGHARSMAAAALQDALTKAGEFRG